MVTDYRVEHVLQSFRLADSDWSQVAYERRYCESLREQSVWAHTSQTWGSFSPLEVEPAAFEFGGPCAHHAPRLLERNDPYWCKRWPKRKRITNLNIPKFLYTKLVYLGIFKQNKLNYRKMLRPNRNIQISWQNTLNISLCVFEPNASCLLLGFSGIRNVQEKRMGEHLRS